VPTTLTYLFTYFRTALFRKNVVEDNKIVVVRPGEKRTTLTVFRYIDRKTLLFKPALEEAADLFLIFY